MATDNPLGLMRRHLGIQARLPAPFHYFHERRPVTHADASDGLDPHRRMHGVDRLLERVPDVLTASGNAA